MGDAALSGCGVGLRKEHHDVVLSTRPDVPFFEVISENFMGDGGRPRDVLDRVRRDYPVALHGVSMNLGSADPLDATYLSRLKALADRIQPSIVSDHLCWTGLAGLNSHDLLPLPFTGDAVRHVAGKIRKAQDVLGRRLLVENVSSYVSYRTSEMTEADFLAAVVEAADCHLLLDVNNLWVNARNHGFDAEEALRRIPPERVRQFHLAGHEDHGDVVIDTHDRPVRDEVWALYRDAVRRFGPRPTVLEWDANVPAFSALLEEQRIAQVIQRSWPARERRAA
ncbi:MAG TPA: DUF692 domain-containing protein [Thermoanaerobaculia bacterium]|nr:DUF692 domain-containing protein [Thermoanaerobaculia bacterium]